MPRYKGSFIAKQIEDDNRIYAHRKERALKIKALKEQYEKRKRGDTEWQKAEDQENTTQ